ncbi:MAG TPA: glycosyltransferase family 2 protein [Pyrinomonadaceae bacterium]|jgi:glycosyltransferase involved in cell wall biosynthesis|nr:glycosyltransferase family 2 protein [Pyrinomonadaceae bacterium]
MKISATIITLNEAANIGDACNSLAWADEIVVVDSGSTDQTRKIAEDHGARVIVRDWPGFAAQKQFASEQASHDWIFSLDADERVSDELEASIATLRAQSETDLADGYRISRRSYYQGRWIKGGGWYPDWQLRLFRKSRGRWPPRHIHESVKLESDACVAKLSGDILHYSVRDAAHHHRMIGERYAPLAAQQMFDEGRQTSALRIATAAPAAFVGSYLLKGGFRDGLAGISIASFAAHHAFLKHLMLWEKQNKSSER